MGQDSITDHHILTSKHGESTRTSTGSPPVQNHQQCGIQEKLNEAVMVMNKSLQEVNIQNMNVELVAQMFKNYQSNVLFHLEATENLKDPS
ncbi:DASH complex subunit Dad4-domain-containing protein [Aspergillus karnatakaensis]|uniref:DASH complex subunit DAD4 n=1 Tax=Aspergillus karnatakaensis TaxID=1810916 RepID=UPI003CCD0BED